MTCKHCGAPLPDGAKFCTDCGSRVTGVRPRPTGSDREAPKNDKGFVVIVCMVFFVFAILYVMKSFVDYGKTGQTAEEKKPQVIDPIDVNYRDCNFKFLGYTLEDVSGSKPRIYLYYQFENNGDKEKDLAYSFDYLVRQTAYQNNINLDTCYLFSNAGKDSDVLVKPGGVVTVCKGFYLRNLSSPVEITMSTDYLFFNEDLAKMTIQLK